MVFSSFVFSFSSVCYFLFLFFCPTLIFCSSSSSSSTSALAHLFSKFFFDGSADLKLSIRTYHTYAIFSSLFFYGLVSYSSPRPPPLPAFASYHPSSPTPTQPHHIQSPAHLHTPPASQPACTHLPVYKSTSAYNQRLHPTPTVPARAAAAQDTCLAFGRDDPTRAPYIRC